MGVASDRRGSSCRTGGGGGGGGAAAVAGATSRRRLGSTATSCRSWAASNSSTRAPASRAARCRGRTGSCTPSMASQPWSPMVKRRPGSPVSTDGTTTVPTAALGRRARSSSRRRSDRSPGGTADTITSGSHASGVAPPPRLRHARAAQRPQRRLGGLGVLLGQQEGVAERGGGPDARQLVELGLEPHGHDAGLVAPRGRGQRHDDGAQQAGDVAPRPSTVTTPPVSSSTSSSVPWSVVPTGTSVGAGAAAWAVWASSAIGAPVTHRRRVEGHEARRGRATGAPAPAAPSRPGPPPRPGRAGRWHRAGGRGPQRHVQELGPGEVGAPAELPLGRAPCALRQRMARPGRR